MDIIPAIYPQEQYLDKTQGDALDLKNPQAHFCPAIESMELKVKCNSGIWHDANGQNPMEVVLDFMNRNRPSFCNITTYKGCIVVADFENPHTWTSLGLAGKSCKKESGTIFLSGNGSIGLLRRTFPVHIIEHDLQPAEANFNNFVAALRANGHYDLIQPFGPPRAPMPLFLQLKCALFYRTDIAGDVGWHCVQAASEAFIYQPLPPKIISVHPSENNPVASVTLTLNRSLIPEYDNLGDIFMRRGGERSEFLCPMLSQIANRIEVDASGQPNLAAAHPISASAVRLRGSSGSRSWDTPPGKRQRQGRVYDENEVELDDGGSN